MATLPSEVDTLVDTYDFELGYHASVPPLDVRLGQTEPRSSSDSNSRPIRWGILSTGKAAHDFTQALKRLEPYHVISAVAASSCLDKARTFADLHGIPHAHGTYADLCSDPSVDVVYVASLHPQHRQCAELALKGGKHVLIEKPICMTASDAEAVYDLARKKDLFAGEGMWTRFFPAVEWARMALEKNGDSEGEDDSATTAGIGECRVVQADFSIDGDDVGPYPSDSIYKSELGGGTLWTMGCYVVSAAMLPFAGREPDDVVARGVLPPDDGVGELAAGATLVFRSSAPSDGTPGSTGTAGAGAIASVLVGYLAESSETTQYAAKRGRVTLHRPAHCPTTATRVLRRGDGKDRTTGEEQAKDRIASAVNFPLPPPTDAIEGSGSFKMPNSMGFIYEAEAVRRLIRAGRRTFPQWTPQESVGCLRTIERIREQIHGPAN